MLTGKAKEDFFNQSVYIETIFNTLPELYKMALIIEWLDSVDLNIQINVGVSFHLKKNTREAYYDCYVKFQKLTRRLNFKSRREATKYLISRSVEIYNSKQ